MSSRKLPPEPEGGLGFIDVHCHLPWLGRRNPSLPSYSEQKDRFFAEGGRYLITSSTDLTSLHSVRKIVGQQQRMGFTCGWAPQNVTYSDPAVYLEQRKQWGRYVIGNPEDYLAIGEVGLDFHHAKSLQARERQIAELEWVIELTKNLKKPYVLHVRNASERDVDKKRPDHHYNERDGAVRAILDLLDEQRIPAKRVMWHCFAGPNEYGPVLAERGFTLSVPSSAYRFKRWRRITTEVPLDALVTETDAPYQHPTRLEPVNEPVNVSYAIAAIASTHGISQQEVAEVTVANARRFFGI
jgi:TatD DNase family protein